MAITGARLAPVRFLHLDVVDLLRGVGEYLLLLARAQFAVFRDRSGYRGIGRFACRGISSRPYKPTIPLDGAPPPSFMAATKAVSVVPVRQSADGGAVATDGAARIAPGETGRLNLERMRWDEKYA